MKLPVRSLFTACFAAFLASVLPGAAPSGAIPAQRQLTSLNSGWRFFGGEEVRASSPEFDDSAWEAVDLPHTWNAHDGQDGGGNYRRGAGWYRRHLRLDPSLAGRHLFLQFDGVSLAADVYVNGKKLGTHRGGFARFRFEATDALKADADNIIAVRADNGHLIIPPISADFTFFGGIYRDVSLLATDAVHVTTMDYGSPGVFLTPQNVSADQADLAVRVGTENQESASNEAEIISTLFDAEGKTIKTASSKQTLAAGAHADVTQMISVRQPHLWNGRRDPYLYRVRIEITTAGKTRDVVEQPVGFRFFRVDPEKGFFLNGQYLDLHGVDRHQDRINKGWAISPEDEAEDFAMIQELGATAIRVAHYQQSDSWYGRADQAGIAVWAEIPFVNDAPADPEFLANAKEQLRELIRQNYNHPAIFFWGVGNETKDAPSDHIIAELAALVPTEDASRLSTYASHHKNDDPRNWHTDVVAFNRYYGWYTGDFSDFGPFLDETHTKYPKKGFGISEYGAGASLAQHEENPSKRSPNSPQHPEEYQNKYHEAAWKTLKERPFVWGKFIWNMFDFASDGRAEGDHPGRNDKGLVSYDRKTRKDAFYFYKANWSSEPVVYVSSRRFVERTSPVTEIKVYSNADHVVLSVNGKSLGEKMDGDHVFRWPGVKLEAGANKIVASGRFGEKTVEDTCTFNYAPELKLPTVRSDAAGAPPK